VAPAPAPAPAAAPNPAEKDVEAAVNAWAHAWAAKDMAAYLGAYGKDFDAPGKLSRKDWEKQRRDRIVGKSSISVKLSNLSIKVDGNKAEARFRQDYKADALSVSSRKTLHLVKSGERWLIVKESTGA
jgi:ketosteroid isomerase-like protein